MATKKTSKAAAEEARRKAAELRAKEKRRSAVQTAAILVGALLFVGAVTWLVYVIATKGPALEGQQLAEQDFEFYDNGELAEPDWASDNYGIPVGVDGVVGEGVPEDATRVAIYEDFMCPYCAAFTQVNHEDLSDLRAEGTIAMYYHPIAFLDRYSDGTRYSTRAVAAAATVAEYDPASFEEFWVVLFANAPAENTKGLTNTEIRELAASAGVSQEAVDKFAEGEFTQWALAATQQASIDGVGGTPSILFDGVEYPGNWTIDGQLRADLEYLAGFKDLDASLDEEEAA